MPLPVIADVWQAVIDWVGPSGQTAKNVMYFKNTTGGLAPDLAAALDARVTANMLAAVSDAAHAPTVTIRKLDGVMAPTPEPLTHWNGPGGTEFVPQASMCVTLYTLIGGRANRGRIYLPFVAEQGINDGLFIGDTATVPTPAWNTFVSTMGDDDWVMQVASLSTKTTHTVHNADHSVTKRVPLDDVVPHATQVARCLARPVVATQRRRQSRLRTG